MKKRILSAILASSAALCGAMGLAACGEDEPSDDALKSDKINSAEAWADAMDFSDTTNGSLIVSGMEGNVYKSYFDGDKLKQVLESLDGKHSRTSYYEYKDERDDDFPDAEGMRYSYTYDEENSKWTVEAYHYYDRDSLADQFEEAFDMNLAVYDEELETFTGYLHERYADFTYDDSKYAYVASYDAIGDITNIKVEIKFKNGKIVEGSMSGTSNNDGESVETNISLEIFDLGKTEVQIPKVSEGE